MKVATPKARYKATDAHTSIAPPALVQSIYESAVDASLWPNALHQIGAFMDGQQTILFSVGTAPGSADFFWASDSIPIETQIDYVQYYWQHDPWITVLQSDPHEFCTGSVQLDYDCIDKSQFGRSVFCNEFLRSLDVYHACGSTINGGALKGVPPMYFNAMRSSRADDFSARSAERLAAVVPHLQRALQLTYCLERESLGPSLPDRLIGKSSSALFVLNQRGRVLFCNASASALVAARDGLALAKGEVLVALNPMHNVRLQDLVARAARTSRGEGSHPGGALTLQRKGLEASPVLNVFPLPVRAQWKDSGDEGWVVVTVDMPGAEGGSALHRALATAFALTPAECRVVEGIVQGLSAREIGAQQGVSQHSVRTHLKSVYLKVGVHRQGDLVRRVLSLPSFT